MSAYPKWMNHDLHPTNPAALCEGETPMSICTPHGNPKLSKRCSDYPVGLGLTAAMCHAATEETRRTL